jgi:hypothetical protein
VWRDIANHAFDRAVSRMNRDPLRLGDRRVHTSHFAHVNVAFIVDVIDRHGDLVRMPGQHHPRRAPLVEHRHTVPVSVREGLVRKSGRVIQPNPLATGLVSDRAGCVNELCEKLKGFFAHGPQFTALSPNVKSKESSLFCPFFPQKPQTEACIRPRFR